MAQTLFHTPLNTPFRQYLNEMECGLLGYIVRQCGGKVECDIIQTDIAKQIGKDRTTIYRRLASLRKEGFIEFHNINLVNNNTGRRTIRKTHVVLTERTKELLGTPKTTHNTRHSRGNDTRPNTVQKLVENEQKNARVNTEPTDPESVIFRNAPAEVDELNDEQKFSLKGIITLSDEVVESYVSFAKNDKIPERLITWALDTRYKRIGTV